MAEVKAEVKGGELIITLPFNEAGSPSGTGKTMVHASTHGNMATACLVNGKPLVIGVNAYVKR